MYTLATTKPFAKQLTSNRNVWYTFVCPVRIYTYAPAVQVDAVFNLELPSSAAHYAHRAGRTGRMGAPGLVISLVAPGERFVVERLSKKLGAPIMVSQLLLTLHICLS